MNQRSNRRDGAPRRQFLKRAALGVGGLAALGLSNVPSALAQPSPGDDLPTMLNLAATVEQFASTHIYTLLTSRGFSLTPAEEMQAKIILDAELKHLDLIVANGGRPLTDRFFAPMDVYATRARFAQVTADVETVCTGAYLAGARRTAELGNPRMAATMGQLACNEAQHVAVARNLIGLPPSDNAWLPPLFYNVSDIQPVVAPFLNGGPGYMGPVSFPGRDRILAVLGDTRARVFPTYMNTF